MPNSNDVEYPTEATIGNQWLRGFESQSQELLAQSLSSLTCTGASPKSHMSFTLGEEELTVTIWMIGLPPSVASFAN
jgi:hypothetical protein